MKRIKFSQGQLTLPFGERRVISLSYEGRENFFWILAGICFVSALLYIYAINATAHNIAVREHLEREVTELTATLSSLEFAYIEMQSSITIDTAKELGFKEVKEPMYVSRDRADSLTLNTPVH